MGIYSNFCSAQSLFVKANPVEWRTGSDNLTPELLAQQLTAPYKTNKQKVESIFYWITDNIAYRSAYSSPQRPALKKRVHYTDTLFENSPLNERVAYTVIRDGYAVCDGYARLFKTLCDYAGIQSEIITGYARNNGSSASTSFKSNHSWNAVYIDSAWHLLDATWAAGHFTFNSPLFVKQYNSHYFLTPPRFFYADHYPEDLRWTLLTNMPTMREFYQAPFRYTAFLKYNINSYTPVKGLVQATVGDTLQFELAITDKDRNSKIAPENTFDSLLVQSTVATLQPDAAVYPSKISYTFIVPSAAIEYIQLVYNKDIIMRYKLEVISSKNKN